MKQADEDTTKVEPSKSSLLRREIIWLVAAVLLVDVVFVAAFFLGRFGAASNSVKLAFTVVWTLVLLAIVIRGLSRVRSARFRPTH